MCAGGQLFRGREGRAGLAVAAAVALWGFAAVGRRIRRKPWSGRFPSRGPALLQPAWDPALSNPEVSLNDAGVRQQGCGQEESVGEG